LLLTIFGSQNTFNNHFKLQLVNLWRLKSCWR
jgi:hypothetical protein